MGLERCKLLHHVSLQTFADLEETNCYHTLRRAVPELHPSSSSSLPAMAAQAEKSKEIDETDEVSQDKDGSQLHKRLMNKAGHKIRERRGMRYGAKIENQALDIFDHYQTPLVEEKRVMLEKRATENGKLAKKAITDGRDLCSQVKRKQPDGCR